MNDIADIMYFKFEINGSAREWNSMDDFINYLCTKEITDFLDIANF